MHRIRLLTFWRTAVLAALMATAMVACREPVGGSFCGNGVVDEASEECDGEDLEGHTCNDVVPSSFGDLSCDEGCHFDTTSCAVSDCGNGVVEGSEKCDCGTDLDNLPAGCIGINDVYQTNCRSDCTVFCGDGVQEDTEECDCGLDPDNLPWYCNDINGVGDECDAACTFTRISTCPNELGERCDALMQGNCCPDEWGVNIECHWVDALGDGFCLRECESSSDCYWNHHCDPQSGLCLPVDCGGVLINGVHFGPCQIPDGGDGICYPDHRPYYVDGEVDPTSQLTARCVGESHTDGLQHGQACDARGAPDHVARSAPGCNLGFCVADVGQSEGTCMQICSWEAHYDHTFYGSPVPWLPCPLSHPCLGLESIQPTYGLTSGDKGLCWVNAPADPTPRIPCSRVTGQLLEDPTMSCPDLEIINARCEPVVVNVLHNELSNGTLIGVCTEGPTGVTLLSVWDICHPTSTSEACPAQTLCMNLDVLFNGINQDRCVPLCDTEHADGPIAHCASLGAVTTPAVTPLCHSWSEVSWPFGPEDMLPTRLGICVP